MTDKGRPWPSRPRSAPRTPAGRLIDMLRGAGVPAPPSYWPTL
jgi:hypothetical protein